MAVGYEDDFIVMTMMGYYMLYRNSTKIIGATPLTPDLDEGEVIDYAFLLSSDEARQYEIHSDDYDECLALLNKYRAEKQDATQEFFQWVDANHD